MAPALGATSRRGGGGGSGAKGGGGGGGRGRGRGRGTGGGGERSTSNAPASAAAAAASPADDAPRSNVKGSKHHDKTKRKGGGGNAPAGSNANQQQRAPSTARPMRTANAVVRKVLIRNIPHTTAQEDILALAEAHSVTKESVWRFVPGKVRGNNRQPTTGRLYLDLKKDAEQARKLIAALNGHVLSESKEGQVALEVEFAPYQKIPREKQRKDAKVGTIDRDPEYLAFLEELNKPKEKLPSAELVADATDPTEVVEKPVAALVKYMNERKVHIRDKGKLKGSNGKLFEKGGTAKRQTKKRDGKPTKEKGKTPKDRRKTKVATAADNTEAAKPRKARATRSTSNKKEPSSETVEPGMVRIMALKVSKAASEPSATVTSSAAASSTDPKDKSKKNAPGGAAVGGRGKARGSERPLKEPKPAKSSNDSGEGGIGGEPKNQRRRDSRANSTGGGAGGNVGGKKEGPDKARRERKKKVFVPKEPSNQSG